MPRKITTEIAIQDFIEKYGDEYDYSQFKYVKSREASIIICKKHGAFQRSYNKHIGGQGCQYCAGRGLTTEMIIKDFKEIHGNKFDYSKVKYVNPITPVTIICHDHGLFEQTPRYHLESNKNCPECYENPIVQRHVKSLENRFNEIHNNKYSYDNFIFSGNQEDSIITCPIHGDFTQRPDNHLAGKEGCAKCDNSTASKKELELGDFIESLGVELKTNCRQTIRPKELDIVIPSKKIAIEYNGLYWHSRTRDRKYHLRKTEACEKVGYQLIHIFEDEWLQNPEIVKSRLKNILGVTAIKIGARKCKINSVNSTLAQIFLIENHIQGAVSNKIKIGLYYQEELISLMTFSTLRNVVGSKQKKGHYELLRFVTKKDYSVIGGASKLLKYFIKNYHPQEIISYADRRWSIGNLYKQLGFEFAHFSKPNYFYVDGQTRLHRYNFQKHKLVANGYDGSMTEEEIMKSRGMNRIYDCGTSKWILSL